jgi:hypothetical protein
MGKETYNPQIIRRWGKSRKHSTRREKDAWDEEFERAVAQVPPRPMRTTEEVFASLRERFNRLGI